MIYNPWHDSSDMMREINRRRRWDAIKRWIPPVLCALAAGAVFWLMVGGML